MAKSRNRKHGASLEVNKFHAEYGIWKIMKVRCYNPNHRAFKWYGAKGIGVCDRWRNSFENFINDMGPRPTLAHSIERRDNAEDYGPDNCVWVPKALQGKNSSHCVYVLVAGSRVPIREAARLLGVSEKYQTFYRLVRVFGFSPEHAAQRILTGKQTKHTLKESGDWHRARGLKPPLETG